MSIFVDLAKPFPPKLISWRVGATNKDKTKGMALAFIDARDVIRRLNEAVGAENWQNDYPHANGKTVCRIGIRIGDQWVWKSDGAGDSDVEAEKGALSDAFKRAAVRWGVGLYLYDISSPWVAIEQYGKSYKIADGEYAKLESLLATETKQLFLTCVRAEIDETVDAQRLAAWWNSDQQKRERRDFGLDETEIEELKQLVIAKRDALTGKKAA
jgi:hypothetical protein